MPHRRLVIRALNPDGGRVSVTHTANFPAGLPFLEFHRHNVNGWATMPFGLGVQPHSSHTLEIETLVSPEGTSKFKVLSVMTC